MNIQMKPLEIKDLHFVKDIYDYYILNSTVTFHTEPIQIEELKQFIPIGDKKYKSYLIYDEVDVVGYGYLSRYKPRQAYDRTAEVTIYLKHDIKGKGVGSKVLSMLEKEAAKVGIRTLVGIITGDNEPSIRLFEKRGFEKCAHFKQVGEKFNRVLDVVAYQKIL